MILLWFTCCPGSMNRFEALRAVLVMYPSLRCRALVAAPALNIIDTMLFRDKDLYGNMTKPMRQSILTIYREGVGGMYVWVGGL